MRWILLLLLALGAATGLSLLASGDSGYILISREPYRIELSLTLFIILVAAAFALLYFLIRLLIRTWNSPRDLKRWRTKKRDQYAQQAQLDGLMGLLEGSWKQAETKLMKRIGDTHRPVLNYLGASQAAQERGDLERRDYYLNQAEQADPKQKLAIGLTQAKLFYQNGQWEQALNTLHQIKSLAPKNKQLLAMSLQANVVLENWPNVLKDLDLGKKLQVLPKKMLEDWAQTGHQSQLLSASDSASDLDQAWRKLPKALKNNTDIMLAYVNGLKTQQRNSESEKFLHKAINHQWRPQLVKLYGTVMNDTPDKMLKTAEHWAKDHGTDPDLLLTLARLAAANQLWGKTRAYLESSINSGAGAEAYQQLGNLLEHLGEPEAAREIFRNGLDRASGNHNQIELPASDNSQLLADGNQ